MFCVYCYGYFGDDTFVCPTCNEYDGMMRLHEAEAYLGEDLGEYAL
jgi:hypothetical protein